MTNAQAWEVIGQLFGGFALVGAAVAFAGLFTSKRG